MKRGVLLSAICAAAALGGCASRTAVPDVPPPPGVLSAAIRDAAGRELARAQVSQAGDGIVVRVDAVALEPGTYGIHLHAVGRCEPPAFASAGPHWNPTGRQHGKDNPQGMHKGDLPNLVVGGDRHGALEARIADASLVGEAAGRVLDEDGTAIVLHASPDDYRTDPSGASGARIGCGVLAAG